LLTSNDWAPPLPARSTTQTRPSLQSRTLHARPKFAAPSSNERRAFTLSANKLSEWTIKAIKASGETTSVSSNAA
jgi:hypothetical protein